MTILRAYDPAFFKIVGNVLTFIADSVGAAGTFAKTYPLTGGALDYTLDANWTPAAYPNTDHGSATVSGQLGDGATAPLFWVLGTNNVAANGLTRTAGARLRVLWNAGILPNIWPADDNGAVIWIPLPAALDLSIQFTIASNGPGQGTDNMVRFGVATSDPSIALPSILADVHWDSDPSNQLDETVTAMGTAGSLAAIDSYVTAGVGTRHYRIELHGPNVAIYGGAIGATVANTLLHGRSNVVRGNRNDLHLYLSLGATTGTPYAEIYNLSLSGKRAAF